MGRATSGVTGMKFRTDRDSVLSMSVIRAAQVAAEEGSTPESLVEEAAEGGRLETTPSCRRETEGG